nr:hypothetical protein [Tanacetum cinerariifolium]
MSDASSTVIYTSVYTDSEPWRYYEEESAKTGSPGVIVYGYDGLPMQLVAPPSPDYVPGPVHLPSPDYVPGPEHPPSPVEVPYVPEPEYPEYLAPSDDKAPLKDQPLLADASPTVASPGYVADSDPGEDQEKDPEDDHVDYPVNGGDGDDELSNDNDDDDDDDDDTESDPDEDPEEEPFEDEEDDDEEEEHLAPADSFAVPIVDPVLPARDIEALEADDPTPTPRSPHIIIPLSQTRLRRARKTVIPEPSMSTSMEACITRHAALLLPPLPVPSPPLPFPSPLTTSPTDTGAPLGYKAAEIRIRAFLLSTSRRTDILEADVPPRKRACLTTPAPKFEIVDTLMEITPTTLEGVDQRVTNLDTTVRQRTNEFEIQFEEAQDDQAFLRARVNTLFRDRPDHRRTAMLLDREVMYAREAWAVSKDKSAAITQLTTALGRIKILKARDPEPQEGPDEASSSCVVAALAERDADRTRIGDNSNDSGTVRRRKMTTPRECNYTDFLKCQPMSFQSTEGVIDLTRWLEKMKFVFQISNCLSHVRLSLHLALFKMITDKYYPGGEIQKLESEYWNLKVKGLDLLNYNQCFQELALMCDTMFPEELAKVERYIGGLPNMIHGSVKASKPQSMQEAI